VVGRNIQDVQDFRFCYYIDWTISDLSIFILYKVVTFDPYHSLISILVIASVPLAIYFCTLVASMDGVPLQNTL
jgi:hypothetical protein